MRNLHQILLQEYGLEAQCLFRDWERLWLRASDYKNHRIFTLRCLHKELIPVSIKLKSTLKTEKARKIIRKTEKDLLQARIKAINSILDNIAKQTEECRSQLPSIISAQRLRECQGFVDKVDEIRFTKVKQRQLNKYNILLNKKEGNITRANATTNPSNLASQARRQVLSFPLGKEAIYLRQAGTLLPPREGSSICQAIAHLPPREGSNSPLATAHHPTGEGSNSPLATAHLPPREGSRSSQATAHLPSRQAGSSSQATAHLRPWEGNSSSQSTTLPPQGEGSGNSQAGKYARSGRQGFRHSTRHRAPQTSQENSSTSQADSTNSQEGNSSPTIPSRLPQGSSNEEPNLKWVINLSSKPLTPAQRSVLAKGPNFAVSSRQPPNLEYITAIEAACTKLSQQDTEELRADINKSPKVLSPPKPNLTKAQNLALRELKGTGTA